MIAQPRGAASHSIEGSRGWAAVQIASHSTAISAAAAAVAG